MAEIIASAKSPARGTEPRWMTTHSERQKNCGYVVQRLKDLPKLHKAVWKDDLQRVRTVLTGLKKTMYIDYFDKEHRTALHFACARGHDGMVRVICQNGANPNIVDGVGKTPLHKAVESGNYSSVQHLLHIKADPNMTDSHGQTPLHLAAKKGNISAVRLLLERGARTDILSKDGLTALHTATLNNNMEIVQLIKNNPNEASRESDMMDTDEDELLSPHQLSLPENPGGGCSTPLSITDDTSTLTSSSSSDESSDFEFIFDTDDDCSIENVSRYFSEELYTSYYSSSRDEEDSLSQTSDSDQTSSESEESAVDETSSDREDLDSQDLDSESPIIVNLVQSTELPNKEETLALCKEEIVSTELKDEADNVRKQNDRDYVVGNEILSYCIAFVLDDSETEVSGEKAECKESEMCVEVGTDKSEMDCVSTAAAKETLDDSGPDVIIVMSDEEAEETKSNEPEEKAELSEEDELLRKQLVLLNSFQTLVADTIEVTKRSRQFLALNERSPVFACYEPVMFKFHELAIHFLNDSSRVPIRENLIGLAGKSVVLAWVDPEEMLQADPTNSDSFKALISLSPMMQIRGLGVMQWIDFEGSLVFIVSPELSSSSSCRGRVNTIVLGAPEYPEVFHCSPPRTQENNVQANSQPSEGPSESHHSNNICSAMLASKTLTLTQPTATVSEEQPLPYPAQTPLPSPAVNALLQSVGQKSWPPTPGTQTQHQALMSCYSTLPHPPPSLYTPPLPQYRPGPYNYPVQVYPARPVQHLHPPPGYVGNSPQVQYPGFQFNTIHRAGQCPPSAPPPPARQYQQNTASHKTMQQSADKQSKNVNSNTALNQLLQMLQLPPRMRPQEWFTSI